MSCVYLLSGRAVSVARALQFRPFFEHFFRPDHRGPCSLSELRFREIKGQGGRIAVARFDHGDGDQCDVAGSNAPETPICACPRSGLA